MEGVWIRLGLRRKRNGWKSHTTSDVRYLQTRAGFFLDVRKEKSSGTKEIDMAFGGITRWKKTKNKDEMNVKWHAFFDFDKDFYKERTDLVEDWEKALKFGEMRDTDDVGLFVREDDDRWIETDPKNTLRETWRRISSGKGNEISILSKDRTCMLVIVGDYWGVSIDGRARSTTTHTIYATGRIDEKRTRWILDTVVGDDSKKLLLDDGSLLLPGRSQCDYQILSGSTLDWKSIPPVKFTTHHGES